MNRRVFVLCLAGALHTFCKLGNTRENFIFANSVKRHICDVKKSRLRHDLPKSVNDRLILPFSKGYIFTKLRICEVSRKYNHRNMKYVPLYNGLTPTISCMTYEQCRLKLLWGVMYMAYIDTRKRALCTCI